MCGGLVLRLGCRSGVRCFRLQEPKGADKDLLSCMLVRDSDHAADDRCVCKTKRVRRGTAGGKRGGGGGGRTFAPATAWGPRASLHEAPAARNQAEAGPSSTNGKRQYRGDDDMSDGSL